MKRLLLCIMVCLMMSGCAKVRIPEAEGSGEGNDPAGGEDAASLEEVARLERELALARMDQALLNADYENRIRQLEALLESVLPKPTAPTEAEPTETPAADAETLYRYVENGGAVTVTAYLGNETEARIPTELGGFPVRAIGEGAFRNTAVVSVVIPEGVKALDWFAFYGCYRLSSVTFPASVTSIEYGAFELCASSLTFSCPAGSYAERYAKSYGIAVSAP